MDDDQAIIAKLDKASALMYARDMNVIGELWSAGFRLVGSEEGELASTYEELQALVSALFGASFRLRWIWDDRSIRIERDTAWVFAQGHLEFVYDDPKRPVLSVPYRLVAIFARLGSDWIWRLYSGSEPVPRRPL